MSEEKLLPCPFCGGEAEFIKSSKTGYEGKIVLAKCSKCTGWYDIDRWNTRPSPANNTEDAKQLKPGTIDWNKGGKMALDCLNKHNTEDAGLRLLNKNELREVFLELMDSQNVAFQFTRLRHVADLLEMVVDSICAKFGTKPAQELKRILKIKVCASVLEFTLGDINANQLMAQIDEAIDNL